MACENGHKDVVQVLLEQSKEQIDLNGRDNHGRTGFMRACDGVHTDVFKLLLDQSHRGIDLYAEWAGCDPLFEACARGRKDVVQLILNHSEGKFDLNQPTSDGVGGVTPFMYSLMSSNSEIVELFLSHTDRNIFLQSKSPEGDDFGAFLEACNPTIVHPDVPTFGCRDCVKLLLDNDPDGILDLNARDLNGFTGFMKACRYGNADVVQVLLQYTDRNIDWNATFTTNPDGDGFYAHLTGLTGFGIACKFRRKNVVELLLQHANAINLDTNIPDGVFLTDEIKELLEAHNNQ